MKITTIGLDLAKNVFHVVCCNEHGKIVKKRQLSRTQVLNYFAQIPPCVVGMEACGSSHYWARELQQLGHEPRLIPAQFVKAYLRGNKNDYNDALAIAEAVVRPEMRFVAIKAIEQQDIQALYRMREQCVKTRTALSNQIRGLLAEYGVTLPRGLKSLRERIPRLLETADSQLSDFFRVLLSQGYQQLQQLDEHVQRYTQQLNQLSARDERCQRLQTIPGFGPIVASVFASVVGNGSAYRKGRDVSASLGIVPRQYSTGGKDTLLGISKRGNRYLRSLLIHGARAVVSQAGKKNDPLSRWIQRVEARRGRNRATVAYANKMARMGWACLHYETDYQPRVAVA
jgi:transposase